MASSPPPTLSFYIYIFFFPPKNALPQKLAIYTTYVPENPYNEPYKSICPAATIIAYILL